MRDRAFSGRLGDGRDAGEHADSDGPVRRDMRGPVDDRAGLDPHDAVDRVLASERRADELERVVRRHSPGGLARATRTRKRSPASPLFRRERRRWRALRVCAPLALVGYGIERPFGPHRRHARAEVHGRCRIETSTVVIGAARYPIDSFRRASRSRRPRDRPDVTRKTMTDRVARDHATLGVPTRCETSEKRSATPAGTVPFVVGDAARDHPPADAHRARVSVPRPIPSTSSI